MRDALVMFVDVYRAQFKATIALQLQYRVSLVIWLIYTILEPTIYLVVWSAVAGSTGGQVGGYSANDFAAYFILTMLVNHLTFTWIMHEFEYRIRLGQFAPKLLRPIHPIHADIADNIAYKLLTLFVLLPATALLVVVFQPTADIQPWAVLTFIPALFLAFVVRFLTGWTLALAAFWTTRTNAVNQFYFVSMLFFSGQMLPLGLLPAPLQVVSWALPFRWMVFFPVELFLGRLTPQETVTGLAMQLLWVSISVAVMAAVWRTAVRRFTAVGA